MKRILAVLTLVFVSSFAVGYAASPFAPSSIPGVETSSVTLVAADTAVMDSTSTSAPVAAESAEEEKGEATSEWKAILFLVLKFMLSIAGAALSVLVPTLVMKALKKMGLENSEIANRIATSLVKKGINYAESLVTDPKNKPTPLSKKAAAVQHVLELAESTGLKKLARDQIEKLIEGQLNRDKQKAA